MPQATDSNDEIEEVGLPSSASSPRGPGQVRTKAQPKNPARKLLSFMFAKKLSRVWRRKGPDKRKSTASRGEAEASNGSPQSLQGARNGPGSIEIPRKGILRSSGNANTSMSTAGIGLNSSFHVSDRYDVMFSTGSLPEAEEDEGTTGEARQGANKGMTPSTENGTKWREPVKPSLSNRLLRSIRDNSSTSTYEHTLIERARQLDDSEDSFIVQSENINSLSSFLNGYLSPYVRLLEQQMGSAPQLWQKALLVTVCAMSMYYVFSTEMFNMVLSSAIVPALDGLLDLMTCFLSYSFLSGFALATVLVYLTYTRGKHRALRRLSSSALAHVSRQTLETLLLKSGISARELFLHLPAWINYPEFEKVEWFNSLVANLWPHLDLAIDTAVRDAVSEYMQENRPSYLASITFPRFTIGQEFLPKISGIKVNRSEEEIVLDIEVNWVGDPDITLRAESTAGLSLDVRVTNVSFVGQVRVILKPLVPKLPPFSAVSISMVRHPFMDLSIDAIGLPITAIPGLSDFLDSFLSNQITNHLIWPKRIVFPLITDESGGVLRDDGSLYYRPIGVLVVKFIKGRGLRRARRPYIKVFVNENRILRSSVATAPFDQRRKLRTREITYDFDESEDFHLFVYASDVQSLDINVHEQQGGLDIVSSYLLCGLARGIADAEIAHINLPLSHFPVGEVVEEWYELEQPDTGASEKLRQKGLVIGLVATGAGATNRFLKRRVAKLRHPAGTPTINMTERTGSQESYGEILMRGVYFPFSGQTSQEVETRGHGGGVLFVEVERCIRLQTSKMFLTPSPQVIVRAGASKQVTPIARKTLNPLFKAELKFLITDLAANRDLKLEVEVRDRAGIQTPFGKGDFMGKCEIPLRDVMQDRTFKGHFNLNNVKHGVVVLNIMWRSFGNFERPSAARLHQQPQ